MNDVGQFLLHHPEFDTEVSEFVKASGYLEDYKTERERNLYRLNEILMFTRVIATTNPFQALVEELKKEEGLPERFQGALSVYATYYKINPLEFFKLHIWLYIQLIEELFTRLKVISLTLSKINCAKESEKVEEMAMNCHHVAKKYRVLLTS